jgi:glycosyltransferase involved in cell wall biosynthesis
MAGSSSPSVSVVIPTLNEERNLPQVLGRLGPEVSEVVIVDGGSVDRTVEVAREMRPDATVVRQTRTGKGNALACGFAACTSDIIVMVDADGTADPGEIPLYVKHLTEGADFAKSTRFGGGGRSHDVTRVRRMGNDALAFTVNRLFGAGYTDLRHGHNAFWRRVVPMMDLPDPAVPRPGGNGRVWGDGFEIETMINIRMALNGLTVDEIPKIEYARNTKQSSLYTFRDGALVLRAIVSEWLRARRSPSSTGRD